MADVNCLMLILALLGAGAFSECPVEQFDLDGQQCCDKCQPGFGVTSECSYTNNTVCEQCSLGETFSPLHSHDAPCQKCSECERHGHFVRACNLTHDTVCECDADLYFSVEDKNCQLCELCSPGLGAFFSCNTHRNTVCKDCDNGTFSDVLSSTSPCRECTVCTERQVMLQSCSKTQDTICLNIPDDYTTIFPSDLNTVISENYDKKDIDIIPLYCAVLGLVVVGLLGYAIFKHYRRMREKKIHKGLEPHDDVEYSKASAGDSGVFVETEIPVKTYNPSTRLRDIPQTRRKEIEKAFLAGSNSENSDWIALAREIGYNSRRIHSIESRAQQDALTPLRYLLLEWGKSENATVSAFSKILKNIGRDDVSRYLPSDIPEVKATGINHVTHHNIV